ncbi:MAG TPA: tryptophan synthase subunit beta, partial [bacterium]|nr:tryptophan synthase subunit beta [bacterium]
MPLDTSPAAGVTTVPDSRGRFGTYGGRFVPETLMPALVELEEAFEEAIQDSRFQEDLRFAYREYAGRPTPLYYARRLSDELGGARIFLKRE